MYVDEESILLERVVDFDLQDDEVVETVIFDVLCGCNGNAGTSVMDSAAAIKISPVVVRTAYCFSFVSR